MRRIAAFLLFCITFTFWVNAATTSAKSSILMEANTGVVLHEKNANEKRPIASTTKIMTAILTIENVDLNEIVSVKKEQVGIEGTSLYLKEGEQITVKTLLYGLMLRSGNDAAEVLATYVAGDVGSFVDMMNDKAEKLGMKNTNFANPHGLPNDNHFSCAYDMAILTAYAMKNEIFKEIVSTKNYTAEGKSFKNHNKLLSMSNYIDGVKTGFTKAAGRCLVSSAENDEMRLVTVTLNDPNDWDDHLNLTKFGFENYRNITVCEKDEIIAMLPIAGYGTVNALAGEKAIYTISNTDEITTQVYLPRFLYAPIEKGEKIGSIVIVKNEENVETIPLISSETIKPPQKRGFFEKLIDKIKNG